MTELDKTLLDSINRAADLLFKDRQTRNLAYNLSVAVGHFEKKIARYEKRMKKQNA